MPIYEYQCTNCHQQFDLMQKINDAPIKQCPHCFKNTATRLISAAGFQLKGSGWYATDFKSKPMDNKKGDGSKGNSSVKESAASSKPAEKKKGTAD